VEDRQTKIKIEVIDQGIGMTKETI